MTGLMIKKNLPSPTVQDNSSSCEIQCTCYQAKKKLLNKQVKDIERSVLLIESKSPWNNENRGFILYYERQYPQSLYI